MTMAAMSKPGLRGASASPYISSILDGKANSGSQPWAISAARATFLGPSAPR